jgi:hypothetical protein
MPIVVNVDIEHEIILVEANDLVGVADLSEALESALPLILQQGIDKILVDATSLKLLPSTLHLSWFASELSKHTKGMKQAVIISQYSPVGVSELSKFALKLDVNMQIFGSREDAVSWLNQ